MTPKEKAEELFDKYYRLFNNFPNYQYVIENLNTIQDEKLYTTKQCELIAVDELIYFSSSQSLSVDFDINYYCDYDFFIEVKKEIEAL
jgi:hypothetical protein